MTKSGFEKVSLKEAFALVEGLLAHLKGKKSSVELQHDAKRMWIKRCGKGLK